MMKIDIIMKTIKWFMSLLLVGVISSCNTVNTVYFDRLEAAQVNFPNAIRKVGIVNNMPQIEGDEAALSNTAGILEGDGKVAAEALAQGIAETNYFEEVVICDTSLCNMKISLKNHQALKKEWPGNILSSVEVSRWIDELGVDMLFSIERVRIELKEGELMPGIAGPFHVVDGIITPVLRAYIAGREQPILNLTKSDTIYWTPNSSLTFKQIVNESSEFVASLMLPHILPYWTETRRCYYDGGSVEMRDAGVYVREHNWEAAFLLWKKIYDYKKGQQKMRAAFNIALYYEMTGDFEKAKAFLDVASQLVKPESPDVQLIRNYRTELNVYERKYQQLQLQMNRFEEK